MSRYYVHNLETDKLNIFTGGKADWMSLPENQRNDIKRACLWSGRYNCWVSRAKAGGTYFLKQALAAAGFEDRGTEGEKLSFAEQVEAKQIRAEDRAERMEAMAEKTEAKAESLHKQSRAITDMIPMGQPILVGHHSEKRHRRDLERSWNKLGQAVAEGEKSAYYADRAATAKQTAEGSQYSNPAFLGRRIEEAEAELRQVGWRMEGKYYSYSTPEPISDDYRQSLERQKAEIEDRLGFYRHCLETCGKTVWNKESLNGKQVVKIRGEWRKIVKLNPKTVSVPNSCFITEESQIKWAMKYPYTEVQDAQ